MKTVFLEITTKEGITVLLNTKHIVSFNKTKEGTEINMINDIWYATGKSVESLIAEWNTACKMSWRI